ncbi:MAG: D-2-hydroxyacid dehydrogenase family protein [Lentimicrobiaceae bacterium]|jgi:D-3-phosphoglycerate dehydrogenase
MKITILDDYQNVIESLKCFELLKGQKVQILHATEKNPDKLASLIADSEILVLTRERTEITDELLKKLPNLKLISQTGKISNHLDLSACTKYNIAVAEGVGSPIAPAELAWCLIQNAYRQIPQAIEAMKKGLWQTNIGKALNGQTIGIWGYGKIGRRIAAFAKAFEMKVVVWGSENSRNKALNDGFLVSNSKEEFFSSVDILTLHLRLVKETTHIVTGEDLALMKPDSLLVNISRAELIEPNALENALIKGKPGFAALDVFESEPISDTNYPLFQMPNVICTPHLGYVEKNGYELYFSKAFENIIEFAKGNPINIANPEVLKQ